MQAGCGSLAIMSSEPQAPDPSSPQLEAARAGLAAQRAGRLDEAIAHYRRALALEPGMVVALSNLGGALVALQRHGEAEPLLRRALALAPDYAPALTNLAAALNALGQWEEALPLLEHTLAAAPGYGPALLNLGQALLHLGRFAAGIARLREAVAAEPASVAAHQALAQALVRTNRLSEAIGVWQAAIALAPERPGLHAELGSALAGAGDFVRARAALDCAGELGPELAAAASVRLFSLNYLADLPAEEVFRRHRAWGEAFAQRRPPRPAAARDRDPHRVLRIGYVSPDFRSHPIGTFALPLIVQHDRSRFHLTLYSDVERPDAVSGQFRQHVDGWVSILGAEDDAVAERIAADRIDILVDLAGHTASNRMPVFARRPAPVQVTWLYPNTTGLPTIDFRLTDAIADPPGVADQFYSERQVRLPGCLMCYGTPAGAPAVAPAPAAAAGRVTFGSFNTLAKINPGTAALWSRVVAAVPGSRLLLKAAALGDADTRERCRAMFAAAGLAPEALELRPSLDAYRDHLDAYRLVDIALDATPYTGATTTCEALWMGVPVVTLLGNRHSARVSASLLTHAGYPELVARAPDAFVEVAARLAADLPRLRAMRAGMRERVARSPLCTARPFAAGVEAAYREMWTGRADTF
jgi:predicted O-linked N-acetylglucosamine transferase (SPINDLY family)